MKTYSPKPRDIEHRWYVLDASGAVLGRLATQAAAILRGKHKPIFAPHADTGDHVIVINAKEVTLTGGKPRTKVAYRHSGYPGGLTETPYERLLATKPAFAVEKAIKGMLPKNRLGRQMARKLRVYAGADHRHEAQNPQPLGRGEVPTWTGLPEPERAASTRPSPKAPAKRATSRRTGEPATKAPAKKRTTAKDAPVKRATAKSTTAKRTTAKSTTSKSTATKSTATKSTATKSTAKRPSAKSTAKRSTAKRSSTKES